VLCILDWERERTPGENRVALLEGPGGVSLLPLDYKAVLDKKLLLTRP